MTLLKKIIRYSFFTVLAVIIVMIAIGMYNIRDRYKGYETNIHQGFAYSADKINVGVGIEKINPLHFDTWSDVDNNFRYEPEKGDKFNDLNNNGKFDPVWMAGFHNNRPVNGVHDDLWARCVYFDDSNTRLAMVSIDAIGFFHDDVIDIRQRVKEMIPEIDHVIINSSHSHQTPDIQGNWGPEMYKSGVNQQYIKFVKEQIVNSISTAYNSKEEAKILINQIDSISRDLIADTRPPYVFDDGLRMMKIVNSKTDSVICMLINHGNHPETAGSENVMVSSDFVHYLREGIERGINHRGEFVRMGTGGKVIFLTGAVGGLMTSGWVDMYDPWLDTIYPASTPSFDKAMVHGHRLADLILTRQDTSWSLIKNPSIRLSTKTILLDIDNMLFRLASHLGIFNRSVTGLKKVRSEINLFAIGDAWFLTIPGEINPEIIDGGIELPQNADFNNKPVEIPPLRSEMKGRINFVLGLSNDEVGYIMPKSHWDAKAPYTYDYKDAPYGEINSLGPETGPVIHKSALDMIRKFKSN
jgi:hypothetical protein